MVTECVRVRVRVCRGHWGEQERERRRKESQVGEFLVQFCEVRGGPEVSQQDSGTHSNGIGGTLCVCSQATLLPPQAFYVFNVKYAEMTPNFWVQAFS